MAEPNYRDIAQQIVNIVGKDNIVSATHCATRLRLIVKDKDAIDGKALEKVPQVKGTFFNAGQYQIILGTGIVNKAFGEMSAFGLSTLSKAEQDEAVKAQQKGIKRLMRTLGDIFVPIIPIIAATGLFLGLKGCLFNDNVLALFGVTAAIIPEYVATLVNVLTETAFAFLPAIICWSAYKVFGGMPVIGLVLGLMLVSPILPNAYAVATPDNGIDAIMAFGAIPLVGCQGSVLTAILTALIGAMLEKKLRKIMPNALDLIMTPFVVMLVTFLVVILGIGPVMHIVELKLVAIVEFLVTIPFGIGGFIIGATYPLLVITGLHHTYTMIETSLLANTGFNPVITLCAMYGFANVGTCLAFFVKSKKKSIRQTSIGAMLSQLFGISEPVLFGIQLRFNLRPLIMMLLTSGTGAALLSILHIQSNSYSLAVLPSYLMYIYEWRQLLWYFVISVFSVAMCFVLTTLFAIPKEVMEPDEEESSPVQQPEIAPTASVNCQPNLPQVHTIVRMMRMIGEIVCPSVILLGEVVMEPVKVVPYFGTVEKPECHLLYNVTTMCTTWHTVATKDTRLLRRQLDIVNSLPKEYVFLNYLRCHDDIGWGLDYDWLSWNFGTDEKAHKRFLSEWFQGHWEGSVSRGELYNDDPASGDARQCGTTASLCGIEKAGFENDPAAMERAVRFDLTLHAMMFMQTGLPLLYSGDELAQVNDYSYKDDPKKAEDSRYLHRGKLRWDLAEHAHDLDTPEGQVFCGLNALGALRKTNPAFGTKADVWTLDTGDDGLLAIGRYFEGQKIIGVFNFTPWDKTVTFPFDSGEFADMLTGESHILKDLLIPAYGFYYLEQTQA